MAKPEIEKDDSKENMDKAAENLRTAVGNPGLRDEALEKDIHARFTYYPPKPGQPEVYTSIREMAKQYAIMIARYTPKGREQSLALTHLEEVVMWANAAIARGK